MALNIVFQLYLWYNSLIRSYIMLTLAEDKLDRGELIKDLFALFDNFGNQNGRGLTMII